MFKKKNKLSKHQINEFTKDIQNNVLSKQEILDKWKIDNDQFENLIAKIKSSKNNENLPDWVAKPQKAFDSQLEEQMYYDMIKTIERRKFENSKSTKEKMNNTKK